MASVRKVIASLSEAFLDCCWSTLSVALIVATSEAAKAFCIFCDSESWV